MNLRWFNSNHTVENIQYDKAFWIDVWFYKSSQGWRWWSRRFYFSTKLRRKGLLLIISIHQTIYNGLRKISKIKVKISSWSPFCKTVAISIHDPLKSNDLLLTPSNFWPDGRSNLLLVSKWSQINFLKSTSSKFF